MKCTFLLVSIDDCEDGSYKVSPCVYHDITIKGWVAISPEFGFVSNI